jgi:hypothetical protein
MLRLNHSCTHHFFSFAKNRYLFPVQLVGNRFEAKSPAVGQRRDSLLPADKIEDRLEAGPLVDNQFLFPFRYPRFRGKFCSKINDIWNCTVHI